MEKQSVSEDSTLQCRSRSDAGRPMCSVPPHQQMNECVSIRQYAENGDEEEGNKMTRPDAFISLDAEADVSARRRKPTLVRSKTFDPSLLLQVQSDSESKCERRKPQSYQSLRTNSQYHKVFKDISEDEHLRQSYTCALQKDILYQGRLFVSDNWICFHSKVFGKDTKIAIPVSLVTVIKKTKTAILVPNALVISTAHERHVFVSFLSRDTTFKVLMSVCPHLVEKSPGNSQKILRAHPASLPTDFPVDLSDLDTPVRPTAQHVDDSSSSDCPESPTFVKTPKFPKRSQAFIEATKQDGELDSHPQPEIQATTNLPYTGASGSAEVEFMKTLRPVSLSLNALVLIYLSLVCVLLLSSCYMAFKIVSLEERLMSLVSLEFPHKRDEYLYARDAAEIYSVLSASLLKLEKIHRNLQRLMESVTDV
ncbi:GRAM domain-containing protein 2B isoform X2 [Ctenopharyngodon idella]|uniref:GRAM domain-containing protein 2B isoform X2 n=1 Tax=Ctenopharyngodon idella TaxID=7959 RepID=UPI002231FA56|nr:GRAM domain-containing protein 2B isoform X2 [Ctenopharyngodon idella]